MVTAFHENKIRKEYAYNNIELLIAIELKLTKLNSLESFTSNKQICINKSNSLTVDFKT